MNIETLDKEISDRINRVTNQVLSLRRLADYLRLRFPDYEIDTQSDVDGLRVHLPWDLKALRQARKVLGPGWRRTQSWGHKNPGFTYHIYSYAHPRFTDVDVWLEMTLDRPVEMTPGNGQAPSCKLVQVGTRHVEEPIYEVVCDGQPT